MSMGKGQHHRSRLDAFAHSSDEEDVRESVSSFSRRGTSQERQAPPPPPRVIPLASNIDWREDRRRRIGARTNIQDLGPLVSMRRADQNGVSSSSSSAPIADVDKIDSEGQKRGLEFRSRSKADATPETVIEAPAPLPEEPKAVEEDGDQEAIKALLSGQGIGNGNGSTAQHLVIPQLDETQVLQNDIDTRPEAPTLDDYAAVPIEQFGMAMLRGMGWSEGKGKGPHVAADPKKRPSLLGLGAKERTPLPSSSSSSRSSHAQKRDYRYTPVTKVSDRRSADDTDRHRSSSRDYTDDRHHRKHARRDRSASPRRHHHHRR